MSTSSASQESNENRARGSSDVANEQSPLLNSLDDNSGPGIISPLSNEFNRDTKEETKSSWYLFLLTVCGLGLQMGWAVETSNGSPFLLSLGISKALLALVWIAGPLSGTLVQPYVGIKSDNCRSKWGKRRPFIMGGAVATALSLMILAWSRELVGGFFAIFGADGDSKWVKEATMVFAVFFVYILDFAINVIQAAIRAFIVDCAPTHQQDTANAWIIRTQGVGNIIGYIAGYTNLPELFPFLGNTQFKVLCVFASLGMISTSAISCGAVAERDPRGEPLPEDYDGVLAFFKSLYKSVRRLPPQVKKVCWVQFFAWIGWFPFLFYITTYIGEIYVESYIEKNPNMSEEELDKTWEEATRIGTFALLIFATTTFASSIFLPFIVAPTFEAPELPPAALMTSSPMERSHSRHNIERSSQLGLQSYWRRVEEYMSKLQIQSLTLRRAWFLSHIFFAVCMWLTFFVSSISAATALVGIVGLPWALTGWAPFALIAADISKRDAIRRGTIKAPPTRAGAILAAGEDHSADQAGVVLGIHNVAIAAPQVIATVVSSMIFRALQKPRGSLGDDSVGWVLRFGGLCALVAAYMTKRVEEESEELKEL